MSGQKRLISPGAHPARVRWSRQHAGQQQCPFSPLGAWWRRGEPECVGTRGTGARHAMHAPCGDCRAAGQTAPVAEPCNFNLGWRPGPTSRLQQRTWSGKPAGPGYQQPCETLCTGWDRVQGTAAPRCVLCSPRSVHRVQVVTAIGVKRGLMDDVRRCSVYSFSTVHRICTSNSVSGCV
jgi:hypothetical protein